MKTRNQTLMALFMRKNAAEEILYWEMTDDMKKNLMESGKMKELKQSKNLIKNEELKEIKHEELRGENLINTKNYTQSKK
jgi:hypothetical protein